ncbi:MAG: enoyl-CoA hydratase/isomerase family protein [Thermoanaerobaculia bacterium]
MLEITDHAAVREIRMARPPVNALDPGLVAALRAALAAAPRQGAAAIVLAGRPGMYSAGLDVPALLALDRAAMRTFLVDFFGLLCDLAASPLPVVAAITGHSPAGGAVLSIFCDHRVMAEGDFKIGLNEVQVGLSLPPVIHAALVRVVGVRQAERLAVRGPMIPAAEAHTIGLVDELVPLEGVVERALERARDFLALPPRAMARTRELARRDLVESFARQQSATQERFADDWFGDETQRTMRALVDRLKKKS